MVPEGKRWLLVGAIGVIREGWETLRAASLGLQARKEMKNKKMLSQGYS